MSRLQKLFNEKKNILSVYFTAGFPVLSSTNEIITALVNNGVDLIEVGFPFSDPLADGPVIQQSSTVALQNGITTAVIFEQLKTVRSTTQVPLVAMGYLNPILQFGVENFLKELSVVGFDGVILPDLPVEVYEQEYQELFKKYGIDFICLITPQTSEERIRYIDSVSSGFIYMVSSASTTGKTNGISHVQENYFQRIAAMGLKNPTLVGFGINDHASFNKACQYANGAIVGSAYISSISAGNIAENTEGFVGNIRNMTSVE